MKRFKTFVSLLVISSLAFFLRWFPTLWAYLKRGKKIFLGINSFPDLEDIFVYLANILEGKKGHFLFVNQFGSGPQGKFFLYSPYLLLGHISRILNLNPEVAYYLGAYFFTLFLTVALFLFSRLFFKSFRWRLFAVVLCLLSGGLSLALPIETTPFISLIKPHVILAHASLVLIFYSFLSLANCPKQRVKKLTLTLLFASLLLSLIHVFMSALAIVVLIIWTFLFTPNQEKKLLLPLKVLIFASLPISVYSLYLARNPLFSQTFISQNTIPSPAPFVRLSQLGIGLLLIPFSFSLIKKNKKIILLFLWFLIQFGFTYLPVSWQARFIGGWWIPCSFLITLAIFRFIREKNQPWRIVFLTLIVLPLLLINHFKLIFIEVFYMPFAKPSLLYVSRQETQAWNFLKKRCQFSTVLLSNPAQGMYLPAKTGCRSFIGHNIQTFDYYQKLSQVEKILSGEIGESELENFLEKEEITYVFLPQQEAQKAGLQKVKNLKLVFENEEFVIYETL
jgi:hypothetical protein